MARQLNLLQKHYTVQGTWWQKNKYDAEDPYYVINYDIINANR